MNTTCEASIPSRASGMIHLEPADTAFGVPQRAAVVAGRTHHDLAHAAVDGRHHRPVEERGARGQVVVNPVQRGLAPGRDVDGQGVVSGRIAIGGGHPGKNEAVRRDSLGGCRWTVDFHVSSAPLSPVHRATDHQSLSHRPQVAT
jgi:hypothetical protein